MERPVAFVAGPEILQYIFGPLIGLGEQHAVAIMLVEVLAEPFQNLVGFRQVLVDRALSLDQVGNRVQTHAVDPEIEPKPHDIDDGAKYSRIVKVEVGLGRIETVPEISLRYRIPRPVRLLRIDEDDTGFREFLVRIAPHIEVAISRARLR